MKDSPNLDLLRSCAVVMVLISHLPYFLDWVPFAGYSFNTLGRMGVAIFFVHTSLVLMMSLERHGPAAGPFLVRRFFRIYPLSVAIVLLIGFAKWLGNVPVDLAQLVSNLLLIQNITGHNSTPDPLWTLPYEVQMYLFLPALYAATRSGRPALRTALLCAASIALASLSGVRLVQYVPCFLAGVLAFVLMRQGGARFPAFALFSIVAVSVMAIPVLVDAGAPETPLFWALCLSLGLVIPACRQLTFEPLARCAKVVATYSYGIYLTHVLAFGCAFTGVIPGPWFVQWVVFFVMLAGLPYIAYRFIEKPGIALGIRLAGKVRPTARWVASERP